MSKSLAASLSRRIQFTLACLYSAKESMQFNSVARRNSLFVLAMRIKLIARTSSPFWAGIVCLWVCIECVEVCVVDEQELTAAKPKLVSFGTSLTHASFQYDTPFFWLLGLCLCSFRKTLVPLSRSLSLPNRFPLFKRVWPTQTGEKGKL